MSTQDDFLVFDLETQRSFEEVGGARNMAHLGVSVAVSYDSRTDSSKAYRESELGDLVETLRAAPLVVGFNILSFDYRVLQPYTDFPLGSLPSFDLLADVYRRLGYRVSLDNFAKSTLNVGKSGHGLEAIAWYRQGEWEKLIKYCRDDVLITRDLYLYGRRHGQLKYWDRRLGAMQSLEVSW